MRAVLALCVVLLAACTRTKPTPAPTPAPPPSPNADSLAALAWSQALAKATTLNETGDFAAADAELLSFSKSGPLPALALESDFWRAIFRADPRRGPSASAEARALFDAYLTAGPAAPRYAEALLLRRVLTVLDSTRAMAQQLRSSTEAQRRTRDEEIKKLSDDLDRTMAELERIKRRLVPGAKREP